MSSPDWVTKVLGDAAAGLRDAVLVAIPRAHEFASAAQAASGTRKRDTYGHTMKNRQHECLVEAGTLVDGVEAFRPRSASFELLRVTETSTLLFPWRYATSTQVARVDARMRTSTFRTDLLSSGEVPAQLTLDHAGLDDAELEAQLAQDATIVEELRRLSPVVTIGYASNPTGLLDLGWGRAELRDDSGVVHWAEWETLPWRTGARGSLVGAQASAARTLRTVPTAGTDDLASQRFDQSTPLLDDLGLQPRVPSVREPWSEKGLEDNGIDAEDSNR